MADETLERFVMSLWVDAYVAATGGTTDREMLREALAAYRQQVEDFGPYELEDEPCLSS